MEQLDLSNFALREIKSSPVSEVELEEMVKLAGSYEALFSRKSMQIKARNIDLSKLDEKQYRQLILSHYSFLKRPVVITEQQIFIGNDKAVQEELRQVYGKK